MRRFGANAEQVALDNAQEKVEEAIDAVRAVQQAADSVKSKAAEGLVLEELLIEPNWNAMLSTGSTLLDLALTGTRVYGGGVPAGILIEIFGKSGSGKTSILSELGGSAQARGGKVRFMDPEARLDEKYAATYGLQIPKDEYFRPDTVSELFDLIGDWEPPQGKVNLVAADSLAALSTDLELEKGDKMGMRRAKEFSEGLRKYCRIISERNWIVAASNQVRQGDFGVTTPGGMAVEFYSSARVSVNRKVIIEKEKKFNKATVKRAVGIMSECVVAKSSIDRPYRTAPIYIIFDYGLDDIRANLQFMKDMLGNTTYDVFDKTYQSLDHAVAYIEDHSLEARLRKGTIDLWMEIEKKFKTERKPKAR